MKANKHFVEIVQDTLGNLENENYYEDLILPEPFLQDCLRTSLNKYNHHCLPFVSRGECKHMANHLKAMAEELECYTFNENGYD